MWALYTRKTATTVQKMDCCCKLSIDNKRQNRSGKKLSKRNPTRQHINQKHMDGKVQESTDLAHPRIDQGKQGMGEMRKGSGAICDIQPIRAPPAANV